ncbi:MAG: PTS sugar transporter subunit IIA [Pseudobdellovibrionaceae bacterium]|jgi:PTS system nitrogen regulatory IIA component|nr:PTS sugar transporter subunit IIA [Pseudobdellovibrionaceae bacterium]
MLDQMNKDQIQDLVISNVYYDLKGSNTEQLFKNLTWKIARDLGISGSVVLSDMMTASKRHDVGIGDGVAVLDWKSDGIKSSYVIVAKLESPIEVSAIDERPVDIILVLISPREESLVHLRHLARLTRFFRDEKLLEQLRNTKCVDGMISILSPENRKILAA